MVWLVLTLGRLCGYSVGDRCAFVKKQLLLWGIIPSVVLICLWIYDILAAII